MKILRSKLFVKVAVWLCAELMLNFVGLDDLADYGEFIEQSHLWFSAQPALLGLVISFKIGIYL
jgi:hypothetical protein